MLHRRPGARGLNRSGTPVIERLSPEDLTTWLTDGGRAPMQIGAVLLLEPSASIDDAAVLEALGPRLLAVPRLRQRLLAPAPLFGRPVWVDDVAFDLDRHLRTVACSTPGRTAELLMLAADLVATRLPRDRPLWSATLVTGLDEDACALVVVLHHVLTDGIGGLAVLAALVDGAAPEAPPAPGLHPVPSRGALLADALRDRGRRLRAVGGVSRALRGALSAVRATRVEPAPRTSLNQPTGPRRGAHLTTVALAAAQEAAHRHAATVNDLLLTAVAGALGQVAADRGERLPHVVISVPVAQRSGTSVSDLGNRVGAVPVTVATTGDHRWRLAETAAASRAARMSTLAGSAVLGVVFRLLARLRLFQWAIDHQRLVTTFVTNLHGPSEELGVAGRRIRAVVPISVVAGNVTVAFAALSYAGRLSITVIVDPDAGPDGGAVATALQAELDALVALPAVAPEGGGLAAGGTGCRAGPSDPS